MIVEMLQRYGRTYDFQKSQLYRDYHKARQLMKTFGYDFKVKSSFDLYTFQILMRSYENEQFIEGAVNLLKNQNEDILRHLNYQERQRFYNQEISTIVEKLPCLHYDIKVYLPYYNRRINECLLEDPEALNLKKYQLFLKSRQRNYLDMIEEYGLNPYRSDFCDLEFLGENENMGAFHSVEFNLVYLVAKADFQIRELVLKDKWFGGEFEKAQIEHLTKMILENEDDIIIYDYLVQENLVSAKFIKKMEKKWRK